MILLLTFLFQPLNSVKDTLTSEAVRFAPKFADPSPAPVPSLRLASSVSKFADPRPAPVPSVRLASCFQGCAQAFSFVRLFASPWNIAHQAPLSRGFFRNSTGVGCDFLLQGLFPTQGSSPVSPALQADSLLLSHQEGHIVHLILAKRLRRDLVERIALYMTSFDICMWKGARFYGCMYVRAHMCVCTCVRVCARACFGPSCSPCLHSRGGSQVFRLGSLDCAESRPSSTPAVAGMPA